MAERGVTVDEFVQVSIEEKIERDGRFETEASCPRQER